MYFINIRFPGAWLCSEVRDAQPDVEPMLRLMAECLVDAAVALAFFDEAYAGLRGDGNATDDFRRELKSAAAAVVRSQMGWDADPGEVSEKSDQKYFELLMKSRCLPAGYESRIPTMHARSFVYALDEIEKALEILEKNANMPESIAGIKQEWSAAFPYLSEVRNSAHHMADRVRGKRRKKDIDPAPVSVPGIETSGGVMFLNVLRGRNYGITLGEGVYQEVSISPESLQVARDLVQRIIDSFPWEGFPTLHPTM
ncbi:hypothetical protein [Micrococcus luteus]|uniref:hypothetical protein n=1 Tax=Micrococcus luteus TaxID=1270 RepID=UPI0020068855|nr:hypothetical protein [Micrococcus luteus]MCK6056908.1 hypothetical protein [Micrococcus luteus]MCK6060864.1 hypothetical protein [Micrococcus luteus]MCK6062693.1 hypothetical protein [Micrococcus luteus]MCK6063122.1 hypothetical protein [Micrococcus luteus]MCK6191306.1 hypothetical protein [Micrococcus luteus]